MSVLWAAMLFTITLYSLLWWLPEVIQTSGVWSKPSAFALGLGLAAFTLMLLEISSCLS